MVIIPNLNKKRHDENIAFYRKEKNIAFFTFLGIELVFLLFTALGFSVLPRVVAGIGLLHVIVWPFLYVRNLKLFMELKYFGVKSSFSLAAFLFHLFILFALECCLILMALMFLEETPNWVMVLSLSVFLGLIILLFIERKTYQAVYDKLNFEKGFK